MALFLVDTLTKDKESGFTCSLEKILFNIHNLGDEYEQAFGNELANIEGDELNHIFSIGRYICLIQMAKDKKAGKMFFLDLKNDRETALDICNGFTSTSEESTQQFIQLFMQEFENLCPHYETDYYEAELMVPGSNNN